MRRPKLIATRRGALAAVVGLLVCCFASTRSAMAIECLTSPNQTERGWWSWREIDGRKCWYKKVGAVPPKSEFVWPDQPKEAPPGEERVEVGNLPLLRWRTSRLGPASAGLFVASRSGLTCLAALLPTLKLTGTLGPTPRRGLLRSAAMRLGHLVRHLN